MFVFNLDVLCRKWQSESLTLQFSSLIFALFKTTLEMSSQKAVGGWWWTGFLCHGTSEVSILTQSQFLTNYWSFLWVAESKSIKNVLPHQLICLFFFSSVLSLLMARVSTGVDGASMTRTSWTTWALTVWITKMRVCCRQSHRLLLYREGPSEGKERLARSRSWAYLALLWGDWIPPPKFHQPPQIK